MQFKELEVARQMITLKERLGGGCFGDVHRGLYNRLLEVAVKTLKVRVLSAMADACERSRYVLYSTAQVTNL